MRRMQESQSYSDEIKSGDEIKSLFDYISSVMDANNSYEEALAKV